MTAISRPLRLAEAVGALSLATDLPMGQPLEHGLRTAVPAYPPARARRCSHWSTGWSVPMRPSSD